ncbi:hypothetical protein GPECTOR_2g1319 [Gonium pectorale]|uniref:Uncharacterized protein n=1 Tax=Gonium pectorale TaxID=33097 RepID=A0A150H0X0_GONPE|nr:hypothetical protein GPECTOR_2g1319 [Gonium pectorale]|eukprot:KXZ55769.1 hypothetical protein GPECTOR_2g1319 [Gonium pectorale]
MSPLREAAEQPHLPHRSLLIARCLCCPSRPLLPVSKVTCLTYTVNLTADSSGAAASPPPPSPPLPPSSVQLPVVAARPRLLSVLTLRLEFTSRQAADSVFLQLSWAADALWKAMADGLAACSVEGLLEYNTARAGAGGSSGGGSVGSVTGGPGGGAYVAGGSILACAGSSGLVSPGAKCQYGSLGTSCSAVSQPHPR